LDNTFTVSYASRTFWGLWIQLQTAGLLTLLTYIIHRDVVAAIVSGNLAAFPPSLEVNADIA